MQQFAHRLAGLVAGGAALLADAAIAGTDIALEDADIRRAFAQGASRNGALGYGRVDLSAAVDYIKNVRLPRPKAKKKKHDD